MKAAEICMCAQCRETIRECILATLFLHRRWMGYWTVRYLGDLGWVPAWYFRRIFLEMVESGIILVSYDPRSDDFPRYLSIRSTRRSRGAG